MSCGEVPLPAREEWFGVDGRSRGELYDEVLEWEGACYLGDLTILVLGLEPTHTNNKMTYDL